MNGETRDGFCGHRNEYETPVGTMERTRMQIVRLYQTGVREFWSGGMGWFGQSVRADRSQAVQQRGNRAGYAAMVIRYYKYAVFMVPPQPPNAATRRWAAGGIMLFVSVVFGKAALFGEAVRNCVDTPLCSICTDGRDYCFFQ